MFGSGRSWEEYIALIKERCQVRPNWMPLVVEAGTGDSWDQEPTDPDHSDCSYISRARHHAAMLFTLREFEFQST